MRLPAQELAGVKLDQPLPWTEVVEGGGWRFSYRHFPAFSMPWLLRRTLLCLLIILLSAGMVALGVYTQSGDWPRSLFQAAVFSLGFMIVTTAGPCLATLARHLVDSPRLERVLVTAAIVAGLTLAGLGDILTSSALEQSMETEREYELGGVALMVNLLILLGIYFLLGGGVGLIAYFAERQRWERYRNHATIQRLEREKLESDQRLGLLQAQIEPHFLFNALASARSLLRESPERAEAMLEALSAYLRTVIPRLRQTAPEVQTTLGQQVDICRHYLQVMSLRHGERLKWSISVDESLRLMYYPPFVLITLVENAIIHGIEPKQDGGLVDIQAHQSEDQLVVAVTDTGMGLSADMTMGVGLANIQEQLHHRYGNKARLSLSANPSGGTRAEVVVPIEYRAGGQDE